MSDLSFDIEFGDSGRKLKELKTSLQQLEQAVLSLDKTNLRQVQAEFEKLSKSSAPNVAVAAETAHQSLSRAFDKLGRFRPTKEVNSAIRNVQAEFSVLHMALAEQGGLLRKAAKLELDQMVRLATQEALKAKVPVTIFEFNKAGEISGGRPVNLASDPVKLAKDFARLEKEAAAIRNRQIEETYATLASTKASQESAMWQQNAKLAAAGAAEVKRQAAAEIKHHNEQLDAVIAAKKAGDAELARVEKRILADRGVQAKTFNKLEAEAVKTKNAEIDAMYAAAAATRASQEEAAYRARAELVKNERRELGQQISQQIASYNASLDAEAAAKKEADSRLSSQLANERADRLARARAFNRLEREEEKLKGQQIEEVYRQQGAARLKSIDAAWAAQDRAAAERKAAQARLTASEIKVHEEELDRIYQMGKKAPMLASRVADKPITPASTVFTPIKQFIAPELFNKTKELSGGLKNLAGDMGTTHSAARGLASGFNLLWLTWGQMVPLLAGAAVSNSFMQILKVGSAVETSLTKIQVLSKESVEDVTKLSNKMLDLARSGPQGPKELAEAMKVLSLAGYEASEVYQGVGSVLRFAIAGDTDIAKAADVVTSVAKAFQYSASGFETVGDIISATAAASKSSVEDMGEAFKMASVAYTKYGVGLKDTALALGLLSNVGIKGTAAGTAFRNMLHDLTGRTPAATKALKQLGLTLEKDILDKTGQMRPLTEIFEKMLKGLDSSTAAARLEILGKIFSERGEKSAFEFMSKLVKAVADGKNKGMTELEALKQQIDEYYGYMAMASAQMSLTAENQMKSVLSALQATFVEVFQSLRPYILETASGLRDAFASPGFKSTLTSIAQTIGTIVKLTVEWSGTITAIAGLAVGVAGLKLAFGGLAVALVAANGAAGALRTTLAFISATPLGRVLTGISALLLGGILLWSQFKNAMGGAKDTADAFSGATAKDVVAALNTELDKLQKTAQARRQNISLMELEARIALGRDSKEVIAARAELEAFQKLYGMEKEKTAAEKAAERGGKPVPLNEKYWGTGINDDTQAQLRNTRRLALEKNLNKALEDQGQQRLEAEHLVSLISRQRKEADDEMEKQRQADLKKFGLTGLPETTRALGVQQRSYKAEIDALVKHYNNKEQQIEKHEANILDLIKKRVTVGELTEAEGFKQSFAANEQAERAKLRLLSETSAGVKKELVTGLAEMYRAFGVSNVDAWETLTDRQLEGLEGEVRNRAQVVRDYFRRMDEEFERQDAESAQNQEKRQKRINDTKYQYLELAHKQIKSLEDIEAKMRGVLAQEDEESRNTWALAGLKEEDRAAAKARISFLKSYADELTQVAESLDSLSLTINAIDDYLFDPANIGIDMTEPLRMAGALSEQLDKARVKQAGIKAKVTSGADKSAANARQASLQEQYNKFADEFKGTMSDAISTAIFDGGAEGGKRLRNYLEELLIRRPFKIILEAAINDAFGKDGLFSLFKMVTGAKGALGPALDSFNSWEFDLASLPGLASGGPVNPKSMYRVNEVGMEMLSVAGKDYLMTGAQSGTITPANRLGGATVTYAPQINVDSRTDQAQVYALVSKAVAAGNAKLVDDLRQARVI